MGLVGERDLVGVRDMVERWGGTQGVHTGRGGSFVARQHRFERARQLDVAAAEQCTRSRSTQSTMRFERIHLNLDIATKVVQSLKVSRSGLHHSENSVNFHDDGKVFSMSEAFNGMLVDGRSLGYGSWLSNHHRRSVHGGFQTLQSRNRGPIPARRPCHLPPTATPVTHYHFDLLLLDFDPLGYMYI